MNTISAFVPFIYLNPCSIAIIPSSILFFGGTLSASCTTQILNQLYEREIDKNMKRTENRPLAKDKYSNEEVIKLASKFLVVSFAFYTPMYFFNFFPMKTILMSYSIIVL